MRVFVLRKTGAALVVVFISSLIVFAGVRAIPGDTADALAGQDATPQALTATRHEYMLDRPLYVQYGHWAWLALQGNLGRSIQDIPVTDTILNRLPITLELAVLSILLAVLIGVPAGVIAAARHGKAVDNATRSVALIGHSIPHFWLGLLLIIWFADDLHWLPATGYSSISHPIANLGHLVLPVIMLGFGVAAVLLRQTRSSMLTSLGADYIRTARAKGLPERRVVWSHALRNSLITVVTLIALDFGFLLSGAVITETIFGIPGFGALMNQSFESRDYTTVEGIVLFTAVVFVLVNLAADVLYSLLDPRIRIAGRRE